MRIAWVFAVVGCARDNPFFDDGSTDGADGSASGTATSPSSTSATASGTTQGPGASSSEDSTGDSLSNTDPILTSGSDTSSTAGTSDSVGDSTTASCPSHAVFPSLMADSFVVTHPKCPACAGANYGASEFADVYVDGDTSHSYYVMRFANVPFGSQVVAATLTTSVERAVNDLDLTVQIHAFWPGCNWSEGSGTGPGTGPDGITYNECDPLTKTGYLKGSLLESIGDALSPGVSVGNDLGLQELLFELDVDAVQAWIDGTGTSLILASDATEGALIKPTRDHATDGGLELRIDICD